MRAATCVCLQSKSWWWWLSNLVVLGGSLSYARVRQLEMKNSHKLLPTRGPEAGKVGEEGLEPLVEGKERT